MPGQSRARHTFRPSSQLPHKFKFSIISTPIIWGPKVSFWHHKVGHLISITVHISPKPLRKSQTHRWRPRWKPTRDEGLILAPIGSDRVMLSTNSQKEASCEGVHSRPVRLHTCKTLDAVNMPYHSTSLTIPRWGFNSYRHLAQCSG